jgi:AraC-like DNA-binding protein
MRTLKIIRLTQQEHRATENAIAYINDHFNQKLTPDQLARDFEIPIKKLQKGFHIKVGLSVHSYLQCARIRKAEELLANTEEPIKVIPKKVGYAHASHFAHCFKKRTGMTPMEYRVRHCQ